MEIVVSHRENIVSARVKSHAIVPIGALVGSADVEHALHEVWVAGDEVVGAHTRDRAWTR